METEESLEIEILLSTMDRIDFDFLEVMFSHNDIKEFNILIINQTKPDRLLKSVHPKIRVVNSFETGSPNSRNLAIENAKGKICLFADDDIIYLPDLKEKILRGYKKLPNADFITFEAIDANNQRYMPYPDHLVHNGKSLFKVNNIGISAKLEFLNINDVRYNPYFGVGAIFPGNTEYLFLRSAYDKNAKMFHLPDYLSQHIAISSGKRMGSDNGVKARTAVRYRLMGWISVIWLLKYLFFLISHNYIRPNQVLKKFNVGFSSILQYRKLVKEGKMV